MVEENILCACILEDDIIILDGLKKIGEIENWIDVTKPKYLCNICHYSVSVG